MSDFTDKLNEPQLRTLDRLRLTLWGSRHSDVIVRKNGQDHHFEIDWLRDALDILCGPHPVLEARRAEIVRLQALQPQDTSKGNTGPETAQRHN